MEKKDIVKIASAFTESSEGNIITDKISISASVSGLKIFDSPIFGFGAANDQYFKLFKKKSIIGVHHLQPKEWLSEAKTVISFFLPFTDRVKKGNRGDMSWPSEEWLHGRIEGQAFVNELCRFLILKLSDAGFTAIAPSLDGRFRSFTGFDKPSVNDTKNQSNLSFTSNWSERHAAFVCGLGTFGLSRGLITQKGIAGRFGSIITDLDITPDVRNYQTFDEYCSLCGKCVKHCPVNAISIENGKNHQPCSGFLDITAEKFKPRYGCGKCQVGVPCESRIPKKRVNRLIMIAP